EIGFIAAAILEIGGNVAAPPPSNTGGIQVTAPLTVHGYNTLDLLTQGKITEPNASSSLAVTSLFARGEAGVNMLNAGNSVTNLYSSDTGAVVSNNGGNAINIRADRIAIAASTTTAGGGGRVTLHPFTAGQTINLGNITDNVLELSNSELNTITTTGTLQVGD